MILALAVGLVAWGAFELVLGALQSARYARAMAFCGLIALLASAAWSIL